MYIADFFKKLTRKSNVPVIIYLVLNVFIISMAVSILFKMDFVSALAAGVLLYAISLCAALSPFGEWVLRMQTGCKKIKNEADLAFIKPIFEEVYTKARKYDTSIPEDVELYINDDEDPNTFATGRKTVCITRGMFKMPEGQIRAALAHEFGHLAHKDTDLILIVSVGNLIVSAIILCIRLIIDMFHIAFSICTIFIGGPDGIIASITNSICHLTMVALVGGLTWLWTRIGILLVMKSSRENEYEADGFAYSLDYGNELCVLLDAVGNPQTKGLFANLASSHPEKEDRIERLKALGATYETGCLQK